MENTIRQAVVSEWWSEVVREVPAGDVGDGSEHTLGGTSDQRSSTLQSTQSILLTENTA